LQDAYSVPAEVEPYKSWSQVSGYFDGDGSVDFDPGKWVLHPKVTLTDNYRPFLEMLKQFLVSRGIRAWKTSFTMGAWKFGFGQADSLIQLGTMMWPHCSKKRLEVKAAVDYLDDRITGTEFVQVLNDSVTSGNRTGKFRLVDIPYVRTQGQLKSQMEQAERTKRMGEANQILTDDQLEERVSIISGEVSNRELAKKFGVSPATISRAVFGRSKRG